MVEWRVHGERLIYESPWVSLALTTVEPPGVEPFEHHVVRGARDAAGCVVTRGGRREVLLLRRHRFITDTWGWEIPAGALDGDEDPADAAVRECLEETGWHPTGTPTPITRFHPTNGLSDQTFHVFHCEGAEDAGDPSDPTEASEIRWHPAEDVIEMVSSGEITDGLSLTGLSVAIVTGVVAT